MMNLSLAQLSIGGDGGASALAIGGAVVLVTATLLALRPRATAHSFAWIFVAGAAYSILALGAAWRGPGGDGLQAALVQLVSVLLAGALGAAVRSRSQDASDSPSSSLAVVGRALAWLTLVGLPPTVGFHGKILVYRALLAARWEELTVLAMAGSAIALLPALWAIRSPGPAVVRGPRALVTVALIVSILVLGLHPEAVLSLTRQLAALLP
jgi:NADH-quinone oxidoreductase subunit N